MQSFATVVVRKILFYFALYFLILLCFIFSLLIFTVFLFDFGVCVRAGSLFAFLNYHAFVEPKRLNVKMMKRALNDIDWRVLTCQFDY